MATPLEILEAQVLRLSQADRSRLVDKLLTRLSHGTEREQAWVDEADRREARIVGGQAQRVNGPEAVNRIRTALR